uniref:Uncharacterized protein n=1 Tax=Yersinia ruckeri TaxID=29486 RepID=A0A0A8VB16_YERRU|nr:hypothetical protein CSF007_5975 [Yersinia ruckeri]
MKEKSITLWLWFQPSNQQESLLVDKDCLRLSHYCGSASG